MIHPDTFERLYFHGAKGLVFIGNDILTYRRDEKTNSFPLQIDLPGGGREGDESPFETFKREVNEEFGINLQKEDVEFSCVIQGIVEPNKKSYFIVTKPLPSDTRIIFGNEGTEWMLMKPQEFLQRTDAIEGQQKRVRRYLDGELTQ